MKVSELLNEGTWSVPNTVSAAKKLVSLMSKPLLKQDAEKALYHVFGDDNLFDAIGNEDEDQDVRNIVKKHLKAVLKTKWREESKEAREILKTILK